MIFAAERRLRQLERAQRRLEEDLQWLRKEVSRLRGHVTGGTRYARPEAEEYYEEEEA